MKSNTKDWIQYIVALVLVASGVVLAFLSFFLNEYDIADGVIWYIAQAFVFAGSIFGISLYIKSKIGEARHEMIEEIHRRMNSLNNRIDEQIDEKIQEHENPATEQ